MELESRGRLAGGRARARRQPHQADGRYSRGGRWRRQPELRSARGIEMRSARAAVRQYIERCGGGTPKLRHGAESSCARRRPSARGRRAPESRRARARARDVGERAVARPAPAARAPSADARGALRAAAHAHRPPVAAQCARYGAEQGLRIEPCQVRPPAPRPRARAAPRVRRRRRDAPRAEQKTEKPLPCLRAAAQVDPEPRGRGARDVVAPDGADEAAAPAPGAPGAPAPPPARRRPPPLGRRRRRPPRRRPRWRRRRRRRRRRRSACQRRRTRRPRAPAADDVEAKAAAFSRGALPRGGACARPRQGGVGGRRGARWRRWSGGGRRSAGAGDGDDGSDSEEGSPTRPSPARRSRRRRASTRPLARSPAPAPPATRRGRRPPSSPSTLPTRARLHARGAWCDQRRRRARLRRACSPAPISLAQSEPGARPDWGAERSTRRRSAGPTSGCTRWRPPRSQPSSATSRARARAPPLDDPMPDDGVHAMGGFRVACVSNVYT